MTRLLAWLLAPGLLLGQGFVYNPANPNEYSYPAQVAPGSLATIQYSSDNSGRSAPFSAVVSLRAVGTSTLIPAQVLSVDESTITIVLPPAAPAGPAQLIYKASGDNTKWVEIAMVPASLAISSTQVVDVHGAARANTLSNPAQPGESVVIWGAGLGTTPAAKVSVTIGGLSQKILYAGPAPGLTGASQINFQIGGGTPDGCYVPVTVSYGTGTVVTYLSKSSNGLPCAHPYHLSASDLATLDSGGSLDVGQIVTTSNVTATTQDHASRAENASVGYTTWDASAIAAAVEANAWQFQSNSGLSVGTQALSSIDVSSPASFATVDAPLASLPAPVLNGGAWVWSNSGGQAVPASSFLFNLPPPILIKGTIPLLWSSGQDQTISWNPAGYDPAAILQATYSTSTVSFYAFLGQSIVAVLSPVLSAVLYSAPAAPPITLTAPASAGTLTFPKQLLSQAGSGAGTLTVSVNQPLASLASATFKQANGKTLLMLVRPSTYESLPVDIQ